MKSYIYKGSSDFYYNNNCIAKPNDVIKVDDKEIKINNTIIDCSKIPIEVVDGILAKSIEIIQGIDDEVIDESGLDLILDDEIASKVFININRKKLNKLYALGIIRTTIDETCQDYHIGKSNYSKHIIQPWHIWQDYDLNPWDADIVKRILRTKNEEGMTEKESRIMDYKKIVHICNERIRQLSK